MQQCCEAAPGYLEYAGFAFAETQIVSLFRRVFTVDISSRAAKYRPMIEVTRYGNALVFRVLEAQLQMYAIPQFRATVASQLIDRPSLVVFDMTLVEHIDSSAMGALFQFQRELKTWGGLLRVANLNHKVTQIFKVTKSENAFEICNTVADALKGL